MHHRVVTPFWVTLVIAGFGVSGTLAGVIVTQRWADSRESQARELDRAREQERWAREDQVRTFDHQREAYIEFFENIKAMARQAFLVNQPRFDVRSRIRLVRTYVPGLEPAPGIWQRRTG
jgi:hypothetical protein